MSLALDAVNEEKRVLERVLDACKTSESVARDQKMYSDTRTGSRRLAQAQYIAQMLPGVDSRVVERMAESMRDGIEVRRLRCLGLWREAKHRWDTGANRGVS